MRWETEQTTQAKTRYGCFLPDLTGLARDLSAADLPPHYIRCRRARGKFPEAVRHDSMLSEAAE
jgi:hypothetical protein